jgi:Leucine-rich repeat (LRR) protein
MGHGQKKDKSSYAEKKAAFWRAVISQRMSDLRDALVNTAMEAHTRNEEGLTSIMFAALNDKPKSLDCLLDWYERRRESRRKGWVDLLDDNRRTALMMACATGNCEMVESLLRKDAKHELKDDEGLTAREHAVKRKKTAVVQMIDDWLHESEEELVEDGAGNLVSDGLTSSQRSKLKRRQLEAKEGRGLKKEAAPASDADALPAVDLQAKGPVPLWPEVDKVRESVEMLREVHELTVVRAAPEPALEAASGVDPALWFRHGVNRLELRLAPGALRALPGEGLQRLRAMQVLILNDNALASLPDEIGRLRLLRVLEVARNQLEELPPGLAQCRALEAVNVSNNKLSSLEPLAGLSALASIAASGNRLRALDLDWANLPRLHDITVSHNEIQELAAGLGQLSMLETLVAEHNKIKELPGEITLLKKIKVLKLVDGNPIKDPKVVKMLRDDQRKELWKYLEKNAKKAVKKERGPSKKKKGDSDDEQGQEHDALDNENDAENDSDDSFDITMDEL